jgi:multicomponent Na+:H+ antiporter subunit C
MEIIFAITTGALFAAAIFLVLRRNLIRSAIGLIILANAVNLFLLAAGAYSGTIAPYANGAIGIRSDALPQALILTAIVISMGGFAFVLSMLYIISARYQTSDSDEVSGLKY